MCREHYGETQPPDVAGYYGLLDCPVDICAGRADGVIAKENVRARKDIQLPACVVSAHMQERCPFGQRHAQASGPAPWKCVVPSQVQ